MKGILPPLIQKGPKAPKKRPELPDPNTEPVPPFLDKNELKLFRSLRAAGKISISKVKLCEGGCKTHIPISRHFCTEKCYKAMQELTAPVPVETPDE